MAFKITVDQEACIGCGACEGICNNFKLVDGKSHPVKETVEEVGCNNDAKDVCPVGAISVEKV